MNLKRQLARYGKPKFRSTFKARPQPARILDIGIANDSYLECKAVFPQSVYHGIDYNPVKFEMAAGDWFYLCDLQNPQGLDSVNEHYDLIIVNHVLEHLNLGEDVFSRLCNKLAPGGVMYVEFPSLKTAYRLKRPWSYHFHDDPTHCRFYRLEELANIAISNGCKILSCGPASTPLKDVLAIPRALIGAVTGQGIGPFLLHLFRKIDHIMIIRPTGHSATIT